MRQIGLVTEVQENYAVVQVSRKSACEGCHAKDEGCTLGCMEFGSGKKAQTKADNKLGACVGQRVVLETPSGRVILYAAVLFLLPLLLAFIGYAIVLLCGGTQTVMIIAAAGGFAVSLVLAYILFERRAEKRLDVIIVEILDQPEKTEEPIC